MYIPAATIDDLLRLVLTRLLKSKNRIVPGKGPASELNGVLLKIGKPRARLSRTEKKGTIFSCLGELLWYLSGSNALDFIRYYVDAYKHFSDDGHTLNGAYGPRLFGMRGINQVDNVLRQLMKGHGHSRQAVIQIFDARDLVVTTEDVPCTCTLQFTIRQKQLNLLVSMRSNDAYLGLPHDVFAFTMLQEIIASTLCVEIGTYKHAVCSLHLYEEKFEDAEEYLAEGWQSTVEMPRMPVGDPWPAIHTLLKLEKRIRRGQSVDLGAHGLHDYWVDLARILQVFKLSNPSKTAKATDIEQRKAAISEIKKKMSFGGYKAYIDRRRIKGDDKKTTQLSLPIE